MTGFLRPLGAGAVAGAAGTTALNAATYLDMAIRGRPTSSTPQQMVEKMADEAGVRIPGNQDERENRIEGLAPLSGALVGVGVGALGGLLRLGSARHRVPAVVAAAALGAAAMLAADLPLKATGISDPADWSGTDWLADAIPHLAYGAVTYSSLRLVNAAPGR